MAYSQYGKELYLYLLGFIIFPFVSYVLHNIKHIYEKEYSFNFSPTDIHKLPIPSVRCCDEFSNLLRIFWCLGFS